MTKINQLVLKKNGEPGPANESSWSGFAGSVAGRGHIINGTPCQDASSVDVSSAYPSLIVCDGRGSASLSHFGAREAVDPKFGS